MLAKRRSRAGGRGAGKKRHIVKELHTTIGGKPAVIRIYEKNWKYKNLMVATVHVGKKEMYNKSPRMGSKKRRK